MVEWHIPNLWTPTRLTQQARVGFDPLHFPILREDVEEETVSAAHVENSLATVLSMDSFDPAAQVVLARPPPPVALPQVTIVTGIVRLHAAVSLNDRLLSSSLTLAREGKLDASHLASEGQIRVRSNRPERNIMCWLLTEISRVRIACSDQITERSNTRPMVSGQIGNRLSLHPQLDIVYAPLYLQRSGPLHPGVAAP